MHSLNQLVASAPIPSARPARKASRSLAGVQEVVLGDSTAAGAGLPWLTKPSAADRACGRSSESYAADLASANGWKEVLCRLDGERVARIISGEGVERQGRVLDRPADRPLGHEGHGAGKGVGP